MMWTKKIKKGQNRARKKKISSSILVLFMRSRRTLMDQFSERRGVNAFLDKKNAKKSKKMEQER